jgi:hypothetical protein
MIGIGIGALSSVKYSMRSLLDDQGKGLNLLLSSKSKTQGNQ